MTPKLIVDNELRRVFERVVETRNKSTISSDGAEPPGEDKMEQRVRKVENSVAKIEGSLDWAKVLAAVMVAIMLGGFTLLFTTVLNTRSELNAKAEGTNSKIEALKNTLSEEFRAQRQDLNAQTSAIANSITATKQSPPQIVVVPAPKQP